ncbi:MAG: ABC transporter permease [bacterium]|nr:ABC transporter permease [bacterium]MDE0439744.1 ABC transporter permease [bacterium]
MTADRAPQSGSLEAIGAGRSRWGKIRYVFGQSKSLVAGTVLVGMFIVIALLAKFITPHDPSAVLVGPPLTGVSAEHWFGTDKVGSDVFSKTIAATALDLRITASAVLAALVAGVALGTVAGYYAGVVDLILLRLLEILQSIPTLLLAMMVVVAIGPGELNVVVVMAFIGMPYYARLVRAEILTKRTWEFAEAARMVGGSAIRVAFRHLLPNSLSPVLAYASVNAAWVVLVTAALGFLGIGIEPGTAEWGSMIARGQTEIITGEWWVSVFPGLFVLILTTGFYLLGDGVRDVMDPRSRK